MNTIIKCPTCGSQNLEILQNGAYKCKDCGAIFETSGKYEFVSYSDKTKLVAGLFALLLGGIGIHKFYLGKIGQGILYILFCWTGIPSIIGLIEGILYLTMSDEEFNEKYCKAQ